MRNLSLIATEYDSLSYANAHLTATAFDLDDNVVYATSERKNLDGEVELELWKVVQRKGLNCDIQVRFSYEVPQ